MTGCTRPVEATPAPESKHPSAQDELMLKPRLELDKSSQHEHQSNYSMGVNNVFIAAYYSFSVGKYTPALTKTTITVNKAQSTRILTVTPTAGQTPTQT